MLNISRARVYDTTQWASLLSADGKKKNSGQFHLLSTPLQSVWSNHVWKWTKLIDYLQKHESVI
jgi:hypothetical protein